MADSRFLLLCFNFCLEDLENVLTTLGKLDIIRKHIVILRGKGRVPASKTHREPPFGARRTGGRGEDPLGAEG